MARLTVSSFTLGHESYGLVCQTDGKAEYGAGRVEIEEGGGHRALMKASADWIPF